MESPDSDGTRLQLATAARSRSSGPAALREDCWSDEATFTLVEVWGHHFLCTNRKSFRQQQWQEMADAVNRRYGSSCTDVQCKNRIDTLKKRYKIEKARVLRSRNKSYVSPWPFFSVLATLIGDNFPAKKSSPPPPASGGTKRPSFTMAAVPVRPRSQKRFAMEHSTDSPSPAAGKMLLRRHFTPVTTDSDGSSSSSGGRRSQRSTGRSERGYAELAKAVEGLVEVYERVERWKHRELVELEKQRMQLVEELEKQRMSWFVEMQGHLLKIKKPKLTSMAG